MKNPFGLLTIRRDEDEEGLETQTQKAIDPIFQGPLAVQKHKKKVRPEDKKILEEERTLPKKRAEEEGFTEIRKNRRSETPNAPLFVETVTKEFKREKNMKAKTPIMKRENKRMFDRQSGTGRGREIAKHGAGGKTTWGDPEQLAQKEAIAYMGEILNHQEDRYFEYALNPESKETNIPADTNVKKLESREQEHFGEALTRPESDLKIPEIVVSRKREETDDFHKLDSKKEQKRRKKSLHVEEKTEDVEPVLEQQENTMTYAEYLEQLKKKNEHLSQTKSNQQNMHKCDTSTLQSAQQMKDHKEYEQWIEMLHQKKKKPKEKKIDSTEAEINKLVGQKLILGPERRSYQSEASKDEKNKENFAGKFARPTKSSNDFPEL